MKNDPPHQGIVSLLAGIVPPLTGIVPPHAGATVSQVLDVCEELEGHQTVPWIEMLLKESFWTEPTLQQAAAISFWEKLG
jgi:hypothetical protein